MAYFYIFGDVFDPAEITRITEIKPTEVNYKGVVPDGKKNPSVNTAWQLSTKKEVSLDIEIQLNKLIDFIKGKESVLLDFKNRNNVRFSFVFVVSIENNQSPAMNLGEDTLKFISGLSASIDIDLYVYS